MFPMSEHNKAITKLTTGKMLIISTILLLPLSGHSWSFYTDMYSLGLFYAIAQ